MLKTPPGRMCLVNFFIQITKTGISLTIKKHQKKNKQTKIQKILLQATRENSN